MPPLLKSQGENVLAIGWGRDSSQQTGQRKELIFRFYTPFLNGNNLVKRDTHFWVTDHKSIAPFGRVEKVLFLNFLARVQETAERPI